MSEEIKALIEAQGKAFEAFKAANEKEIAEIKAKGVADPTTTAEIKKLNDELDRTRDELKAISAKANRRDMGGQDPDPKAAEYKAAFGTYFRSGEGERELKALQVNVGADGGFALPEELDRAIYSRLVDISPVRSVATVVTVGSSDYKKLVSRGGAASGWVGETAARPETNTPTLQEIAPTMGTIYANPAATQIMLEDVFFDAEAWLAQEVATSFAVAEGQAFISGNGTNRPTGFLTGTPVVTADATRAAGVLQYTPSGQASALPTSGDTYIDLVATLKAGHRQGAVWMMQKAVVSAIRKLKDTTNQYLWQPGLAAGNPDTFLGYPVVEAEDMPAVAANAFPIAFGNFRNGYLIVDRLGTTTLRDPFTNKPYVMFYTTKRVGGIVMDSEAIKLLRISTT